MSKFFLVTGSLAIFLAIFANRLGLDSSPGWGRGRLALLFIGLVAYGISALSYFAKRFLTREGSRQNSITRIRSILDRIRQIILSPLTGRVFGALACAGIAIYAFWYSSAGRFPSFPEYSNDYIQLGEAFLHGQTSLLEQPGPELKALQNPYDYQQRTNIPYHWDASYYEGKYYLYWGPVPGLIFAAAEALAHTPPSASLMVDLPFIGLGLVLLAIFTLISKHFFPGAASLTPGLFTLMALVNLPFLFLLGNPQIYHTSIIYGQFFLILGLLGWVIYSIKTETIWLIIAGLGWGLAIGSRINLAVSVAIYVVFALIWMGRQSGWRPSWKREGCLLIPLAVCGIGLGVYNLARFGNPLETGQAYQLTIPVAHSSYFSISYLPTNLYIYLFYTLDFVGKFPFVKSALFDLNRLPGWLSVPPVMSFDHNVFGVFSSVPGLWLAVLTVPLISLAGRPAAAHKAFQQGPLTWVYLFTMISLAGLGQFLFLMLFFFSAERYVPDFYLPLVLGTAMLVWTVDEILKPRIGLRILFWAIVTGLIICTVGIGIFGGFGVPPQLFHSFNPALYGRLAAYWNDRFSGLFTLFDRISTIVFNKPH
jgi:hypothetical protein